jgi:hypothetical protein
VLSQTLIEGVYEGEIGPGTGFLRFDPTNDPDIQAPLYDNIRDMLSEDQLTTYEDIVEKVRAGDIIVPDETEGDYPIGAEGAGGEVPLDAIGCA